MGRAPCCEKDSVKRGPWTPEEDAKLLACIGQHGTGSWRTLPKKAGLQRCGKSCRLRWTNYLRPDLKHGRFTDHEEQLIVNLHAALGSRWSLIAAQLPGRTDNDVKNYWNTRLKKKLCEMGIDPITHKPISQLLADLAGSMALPKGGEIAEAALGCFKDDMLNVLMRKRPDWQLEGSMGGPAASNVRHSWSDMSSQIPQRTASPKSVLSAASMSDQRCASDPSSSRMSDAMVHKIKCNLAKAVQSNGPVAGSVPGAGAGTSGDPTHFSHNLAVATMRSRFSGEASQSYGGAGHQFIALAPGSQPSPKSVMEMFMEPPSMNRNGMALLPASASLGLTVGGYHMHRDLHMQGQGQGQNQNLCKAWGGQSSSPPTNLGLHLPSSPLQEPHQQSYRSFLESQQQQQQRGLFYDQDSAMEQQQQELLLPSFGKAEGVDDAGRSSPPASPSESGCSPSQSHNMHLPHSSDINANGNSGQGKADASTVPESKNPWSPSASGSSCSSTSLAAADAAIDGVLSSDVLLWDFSELTSIIS